MLTSTGGGRGLRIGTGENAGWIVTLRVGVTAIAGGVVVGRRGLAAIPPVQAVASDERDSDRRGRVELLPS